MQRSSTLWIAGSAGLALWLSACGGGGNGSATVTLTATNYSVTSRALTRGLTAANTNNGVSNSSPASAILSAAPEAMTVYLQSVAVAGGSSSSPFWTSTASNTTASGYTVTGCPLSLTTGSVNLSGCAGLSAPSIPTGTYTGLTLTFARVADIKGCLRGQFASISNNAAITGSSQSAGNYVYSTPLPSTVYNYFTDNSSLATSTSYTFCTRSDQSYFKAETASNTAIGQDSSFMPTASYFTGKSDADFVSIDLGASNGQGQTMAQLVASTIQITTSTPFTVSSSGTTALSLAVDLNRMLEFEANTRTDGNPPNPNMHTGTSYFFTLRFAPTGSGTAMSAVSAFAGSIGTIQGYQMTVYNQANTSAIGVAGWLTLYLDASGNYLGGTMYEDDDNGLTILKGNATLASGTIASSATLNLSIAGTVTGFATQTLNSSSTATLTANGTTYTLRFTRLL